MSKYVNYSNSYLVFLLVFLGFMSAFGPFVTDMYLPTLPSMATEFGTGASEVQFGITASLLGLAVGQLMFGPLSDRLGRRPVMFVSLIIFSLATVADIYSPNMSVFNLFRFFQGFGGAGGIVLSRSVATDCYSGAELARAMTLIGAINGVAPVAAPVIGGFVAADYGWQGVFLCLLAIGMVLLLFTFPFRESLHADNRFTGSYRSLFGNFLVLLRHGSFMKSILVFALANSVLFSYIASAPFIVQNVFGLSEMAFSMIFALNAIAIVLGSFAGMRFGNLRASIGYGNMTIGIFTLLMLLNSLFIRNFLIYEVPTWISLFGLGMIFPSVTTIAMNHGRIAIGAASAIVGAAGFVAGGIVSPLSGTGDILFSSSLIMFICGTAGLFFSKKIS